MLQIVKGKNYPSTLHRLESVSPATMNQVVGKHQRLNTRNSVGMYCGFCSLEIHSKDADLFIYDTLLSYLTIRRLV